MQRLVEGDKIPGTDQIASGEFYLLTEPAATDTTKGHKEGACRLLPNPRADCQGLATVGAGAAPPLTPHRLGPYGPK